MCACVVQQEGQTSRRDMVTMFVALGGWGHGCVWRWSDFVCACEGVCKGVVCYKCVFMSWWHAAAICAQIGACQCLVK